MSYNELQESNMSHIEPRLGPLRHNESYLVRMSHTDPQRALFSNNEAQ